MEGDLEESSPAQAGMVDALAEETVARSHRTPPRERRVEDHRLRESEERYRALVTATAQMIWTADPSGMTDPDVPTWCAYTGQTAEQAAGTGWLDAVHPDDRTRTTRLWQRSVATRTLFETEYRVRRSDGVYRTFLARGVPVLEADGRVREWVGICQDVTERVRAEEERVVLLTRERAARAEAVARAHQLEAIFEAIGDGVIAYDRDGRVVRSNTAARTLLALDEDDDVTLHEGTEQAARFEMRDETGALIPRERWPLLRILSGEALTGPRSVDVILRALDGREVQISVSGAPVRDEEGIAGAAIVLRDVTERRRLERRTHDALDAVREANRRMDEFLSIASHELKTPLTTIKGNIQLAELRARRASPAAVDADATVAALAAVGELLVRTDRQVGRLNRLVDDLLDVSRIQAGHLEMLPVRCDLAAIVRESVEEQRQVWPRRTIRLDLDADPAPIQADADRIGQVVTNYLTNALKYSDDDRPVEVSLRRDGAEFCLRVRDEGPGLDATGRAAVWDRFRRVDGVTVRSGGQGAAVGLGLGLYISKTIVERHGGRVGVDSTPGQGSTFWFCLTSD